jgi:pimeloyl-ACP methyl ester carboxylesterase
MKTGSNKYFPVIIFFLFLLLCINLFAEENPYPFKVERSGKGSKSIIFIPGFACSGDVWNDTKKVYEKDFTCYVLKMPGFAGVKPEDNPSFAGWEKAIADFITKNKVTDAFIVGHSMGGGLALALASDYPKLFKGIVIVDALPCLSAFMNPAFKASDNPDCSELTSRITNTTDKDFYTMQKSTMPRLVADTSRVETIVSWSMQSDRKTFAEMYCDFSNTDLRDRIAHIECPAMILLESPFKNMKEQVAQQYSSLKGAELYYADRGLHFIMYDDPEWYISRLKSFLLTK